MKHLDALFVALYRGLPHDLPRVVAVLALALTCNQLTLAALLGPRWFFSSSAVAKLGFLVLSAANAAWVTYRYRPSQRGYHLQRQDLPMLTYRHAVGYLIISLLLALATTISVRQFSF